MSTRTLVSSILAGLIFLAGEVLALPLSGFVLWGEMEVRIRSNYSADETMRLECPLMLAGDETAVVRGSIVNYTAKEIKPVVSMQVAQEGRILTNNETFLLQAGETVPAEWTVSARNSTFDRLILVNVRQSQYRDNPSRWGACSIVLYSLFGLNGSQTFRLILTTSILFLLAGGALWYAALKPLRGRLLGFSQAGALLGVVTLLALFTLQPRWWGLTLILCAFSLLLIGVAFFDILLFSRDEN